MNLQQILQMLQQSGLGGMPQRPGMTIPGIGGNVQLPGGGGIAGGMGGSGMGGFGMPNGIPQDPGMSMPQAGGGMPPPQAPPQPPAPQGFRQKMMAGLGAMRDKLTPIDPAVSANMDPEYVKQLRNQAMLKMGIGMMGASGSQGFGGSVAAGLGQAQGGFNEATQDAYGRNMQQQAVNRGLARQDVLDKRYDAEQTYSHGRDVISDKQHDEAAAEAKRYHDEYLHSFDKRTDAKGVATKDGAWADFDPDTRRSAATYTLVDPTRIRDYASFGSAGQSIRTGIALEQTKLKKELGITDSDVQRMRASAKANVGNLNVLTKQSSQIQAAEQLARFNGDRVLALVNMVDDTGVPLFEGISRSARAKMGGVDEAELKSVIQTFQFETARMLNGNPNMTGVVSDTLRKEIADMAPGSMSADQAKRIINRLYFEMDFRNKAVEGQIDQATKAQQLGLPNSDPNVIDFGGGDAGGGLGSPGPGGMRLNVPNKTVTVGY